MTIFRVASLFFAALLWAGATSAACVSQTQCDGSGTCKEVRVCDDPVELSEIADDDPMAEAAGDNCRTVNICNTPTLVCD